MITLLRTDYAFAELNATPEEWEGIKTIVQSAVDNYANSDLDCVMPGRAEDRRNRLESMAGRLMVTDPPPATIHREDLEVLLAVALEAHKEEVPGVDPDFKDRIADELLRYNAHTLFAGPWSMATDREP
jgi:hypothetical protein